MIAVSLEVDGRRLTLSSPDRVLWPETGFAKRDLAEYYRAVAPALLPHLAGRAVMLARFPAGVEGRGFAQTECRGRPDWLPTVAIRLRNGEIRRHCVVDSAAALVWVSNLSAVELHPFLARAQVSPDPTAIVFDLDPRPPPALADCCRVALRLRELLAARGMAALPKTSGSLGLHVYAPVGRPARFDETKAFAREIATGLAAETPESVTADMRRSLGAGKVLVDWLQNDPTRSTVAPYSLRATRRPTVSTPLAWDEVAAAAAHPRGLVFGPAEVLERVERLGDLFAPAAAD